MEARKRAPPLAAIYNLRRSCTLPFCRITGKSHSMDEHHYVPCLDDFPKLERHSGCRITEKNQYFKDYKFAYPILDLDGTARMVTEHDFHCRITSKYRAMAGHRYLYPVLGATTDKTAKDLVSVAEEERMRDVLIPREVEMIVKGGVGDVLKMREGEYLFIQSGEGAIIPAAMKEILGKRGVRQGRRHTLPAGLEGGAGSDLEEFRRSLKIKMLSEIKNPPQELSDTDVFDKIQEKVEVLKDIRKSRPKRPGKNGHRVGEVSQKRMKTDENAQKDNIIIEAKDEDLPQPRLSRLEKYKLQFGDFESNNSNNESGNRLTLVGAFDQNDVVELDFGEPMSVEVTHVEAGKMSTAVISDGNGFTVLSSQISEISEILQETTTSESVQGRNYFEAESVTKSLVENSELSVSDKSVVLGQSKLMTVEKDRLNSEFEAVERSLSNSLINEAASLFKRNKLDSGAIQKEGEEIAQGKETETENARFEELTENLISNDVNGKISYNNVQAERNKTPVNCHEAHSNGFQLEMREVDELDETHLSSGKKTVAVEKKIYDNVSINESVNSELIAPKKLSRIPQSNLSKSLMSELKSKLKKKIPVTEAPPEQKESSPTTSNLDKKHSEANSNEHHFEEFYDSKQTGSIDAKRNLSIDGKIVQSLFDAVSETKADSLDGKKTLLNNVKTSATLKEDNSEFRKPDSFDKERVLLNCNNATETPNEIVPTMKLTNTFNSQNSKTESIVPNSTVKSSMQIETVDNVKLTDSLNLQGTLLSDIRESSLNNTETISSRTESGSSEETDSIVAKRTVHNDGNFSTAHSEDVSMVIHTDSAVAKRISSNDTKGTSIHSEHVSTMTQPKALDAKKTLINDGENSHAHSEITKRRLEYEDLCWEEVEHKENEKDLRKTNNREYETFTSKNGEEFVESSHMKKIKLEGDTVVAKLNQTLSENKQTWLEDLSLSEKSLNDHLFCNGVSEIQAKDISVNETSLISSTDGNHNTEIHPHDTSKGYCAVQRTESVTEDSINRSLIFGSENKARDKEASSISVNKTEMNSLFEASDIQTKASQVGNISKKSETVNKTEINPLLEPSDAQIKASQVGNISKKSENLESGETNRNYYRDCGENVSGHLTDKETESSLSLSRREKVVLSNQISTAFSSELNNVSNQISSSFSSELNNVSKIYNNLDLSHSIESKSEMVVDETLSNEKIKNLTMSHSEMKVDSQSKTFASADSQSPFFTKNNSRGSSKTQGMQIKLPVESESSSQESADENNTLDTADDRRITSSGDEGNEKQCQGLDVYVAIMDFKPMGSDEEAVAMKEGQRVEIIDASKPRRWLVRTVPMSEGDSPQEGWVPACYLEKSTAFDTLSSYVVTEADPKEIEAMQNREAIVKELVETEEDFAKDLQFVVENYYRQMDNPRLPKEFRDRKGSVFGNFKDICDFHNNVLMKGVNYHASQPTKLGKTFLRLERDFDMHATYCWNEARAQRLLQEGPLREFFDEHSRMIDDDKLLTDHLKLPIQRLNDYQLLLKELIKYSGRLGEETSDLQKALDFIHGLNSRTRDLQRIQAIEGCKGDLLKIGRIHKHEVFDVCEGGEVSASERHVFLFKGRLFVTEKKCAGDKEAYHVTNLFRLQDVDLVENVEGDALKIVFKSHKKSRPGFPLSLRARSPEQKSAWIKELHAADQVVEDLGDLEPRLEHPLVGSDEQLAEKPNVATEATLEEKPAQSPLKRQDSVKKPAKTPDSSAPQTPTDVDGARPSLKKQESIKKSKRKPSDSTPPETPTDVLEKPPKLLRQDSKKVKSSDSSAPETPTEASDKRPKLTRQDSKKSKEVDSSAPGTPVESSEKPTSLSRQESKSKASDSSVPETPIESTEKQPPLSRQESNKSKAPETPIESKEPKLTRQESKKSEASAAETPTESKEPKLTRQESKKSEASAPETPIESKEPKLTRQDSKKSEASAPETPTEIKEPKLRRQDSKKSEASAPATPTESKEPKLTRQDSKKSKASDASAPGLSRQDSVKKKTVTETEKPLLKKQESVKEETPKQDFDPMDKPRFSKTLRGVTCNLGETAVLECETEGSPAPGVTWLRDNQKLEKSQRIEASSSGQKHSLTIREACPDDGGLYTVVALNSKGQASCSAPLNLKLALLGLPKEDSRPTTPGGTWLPHAPVFKVKLNKETQLLEGTSVRFELVVRGNPEPNVKFLKDGRELQLDDRVRVAYESREVFELILDHVVAKDAGTYAIVATNPEGEDRTEGNLSVVKHKDVFKGLELEEVEREPTPRPKTPKFRWFKNGECFEANERFQVVFNEEEDSLALLFQHVTPEDAGLYTCVASTASGSKIACSAELTVQGVIRQVEAPSIKAQLTDAEATEGGSAMLELKITGYPKPKVTWFHKGKEVSTGGRIRFLFADEETFTLVIKNVTKSDGGQYSVKAANEMGEAESECKLTVRSAPTFLKGLKDMSVMADELLKFEVEIDGNPAPEVKWYKDGKPLGAGDRVRITAKDGKHRLEIPHCRPADSGSYSVVISNDLGNQAEFSNVLVKASPTFVKGMENVEGMEGDTLRFNVQITGNPKPTIKWLKDGKELSIDGQHIQVSSSESDVYVLSIQKATAADVGAYTCEIRNEHGLKASSGNLNIKMAPEFIKKLSDLECNEGDVALVMNTTLKGHPAPSVKWYQGDKSLESDKSFIVSSEKDGASHSLKVKKVDRCHAGKYTCEATNEMGRATTTAVLSVNVLVKKPEIEQELKPTQLVEGKPGKLVAKVSGEPKPKVTWLKDGEPISLNGRFSMEEGEDGTLTLLVSHVTPDDAGLYSLLVTNDEGEASSQAPVSTIPPGKKPEFVKELEKADLLEGQPVCLEAKVSGKPTSIKWQKDGEEVPEDGRIRLSESPDGTVSLSIERARQGDAGKYTVIAANAEGKARSAALVQVQGIQKAEIEGSLEPLTLKDGETGELKVKASGIPKPTVTWLKDGQVLRATNRVETVEEPDGTVALVIRNARPEDAGHYSVLVQNTLGEAKSAAPLQVEQAPTFAKPLEAVNVVEGYPAKLEAKLAGSPPPEIKWMKDGEEIIPDDTHLREVRHPDGTVALLIDSCSPEDAAKYSLVAKNPLGESCSSGQLGVSGKESDAPPSKPSFVTPLPNLTVKEGEPIRLEAQISGNPLPDISWTVNDRPITPTDNTLITFDGEKAILEIRSSTPDHIGSYQCKLSNPLGEADSQGSVSVQEKSAPHFIQRLNDFNGFIGQPLRLSCKVTGYPEPEVDWYFNGDLVSATNPKYNLSRSGETHTLALPSCTAEDNGVYECKARNPVGEDHTRAAVNISDKVEKGEPPFFLKKIGDNEVMEGMTAKFTACVTGCPTPQVTWFKDGQPLDPTPRHKMELESTGILRLVVREVEEGDYGQYSVTLANCHGSATCSAKLGPDSLDPKYLTPIGDQFVDFDKFKKTGIPVPLSERPRIIRMGDDALTLGWRPSVPTCPRVPVTYQLEMAKHPDGEWTPYKTGLKDTLCDVRDLRPGQDYKFQVRVENKHGVSDPSPYVTAHRSKIHGPPADFKPRDFEIEHPPLPRMGRA